MGLILLKPTINYAKEYLSYLKPVNDEAGRLLIARTTFLGKSACCLLKFTVSYNGYHHHTMGIFCAGFTPPSSSLLPPPGLNPPEGVFPLSLNFRRRLQKPIICY